MDRRKREVLYSHPHTDSFGDIQLFFSFDFSLEELVDARDGFDICNLGIRKPYKTYISKYRLHRIICSINAIIYFQIILLFEKNKG